MDDIRCYVCLENYSVGAKAPLFLPCGHTFCRSCLTTLTARSSYFLCPNCRSPYNNLQLEQLPVNFDLLQVSSTEHDRRLNTKKSEMNDQMEVLREEVRRQQRDVWSGLFHLLKADTDLTNLITTLKAAPTIEEIDTFQSQVQLLKEQKQQKLKMLSGALGTLEKASEDTGDQPTGAVSPISTAAATGGVGRATLDCRDGRLLLQSVSLPTEGRLSIQLPTEVFLELSVGSCSVGRVYIQLRSHLHRAQQFLVLCLGSLGPSYIGASATNFISDTEKGLLFPHYTGDNKAPVSTGLFSSLEWRGRHERRGREGIVVAGDCGTGTSAFIIITEIISKGKFGCPFGKVISGMEVVREAMSHPSTKEVTITNCGVVMHGEEARQEAGEMKEGSRVSVPEKEDTISESGEPVPEKEDTISESGEPVPQKEDTISESGEPVPQKEDTISESGEPVPQKEDTISESGEPVPQKEDTISESGEEDPGKYGAIPKSGERFGMEEMEPQMAVKLSVMEMKMSEREINVYKREENVYEREVNMTKREDNVTVRELNVFEREKNVMDKEQAITEREKNASKREDNATVREVNVFEREKNATKREERVTEREINVTKREERVTEREMSVS